MGNNAVTAIGKTSNTHHIPTQTVAAKISLPAFDSSSPSKKK